MPEATPDRTAELLTNLPVRISDVVKPWAERSPDRRALVESSGTWTYRQLASAVSEAQQIFKPDHRMASVSMDNLISTRFSRFQAGNGHLPPSMNSS